MAKIKKKILIYIHGMLPLPGQIATGNGIRAGGLGEALKAKGYDIHYCTRKDFLPAKFSARHLRNFHVFDEKKEFIKNIRSIKPKVIIFEQGDGLEYLEDNIDVPIVADLFAPRVLEVLFVKNFPRENFLRNLLNLKKADFFLVSSERQKYLLVSLLILLGFSKENMPIAVIPISASPELPQRKIKKLNKKINFVYGGVFWPWQKSTKFLVTLIRLMEKHKRGYLYLFGGEYKYKLPNYNYENPLLHLPKSKRLIYKKMLSYDKLLEFYLDSSVAVDVMLQNIEREASFSFRAIDYLKCGLPLLTSNYTELAKDIEAYQAGWPLDLSDISGFKHVAEEILLHPEMLTQYSENARQLIRDKYTWDKTIQPLLEFCHKPKKIATREDYFNLSQTTLEKQEKELVRLRAEIEKLVKHIQDAESRISNYQKLLDESQDHANKLEKEKKELYGEFLQQKGTLEENQKRIAKYQDLLSSAQNYAKGQEKNLLEARKEVKKLGQYIQDAESRISNYQKLLDESQNYSAKLDAEKKVLYEECLEDKQKFQDYESRVAKYQELLDSAQNYIRELEKSLIQTRQELSKIKQTKLYKMYEKLNKIVKKHKIEVK